MASNPITLFYTADEKYLWGSSWTTIFKVSRTKTSLAVVDFVRKKVETIMEDKFHGAYALLTQEVGSVLEQTTIAVLISSGICVRVDRYVVSGVSF